MWNKLNPADENNLCTWAMRCLLVEDGNRLILIDTGIGDKQDAKFFSHYHLHGESSLDSSLAQHGFHRDDITDVFLTHLHFDHCGGAIMRQGDQLVPAFKNATYWSHADHWNWAVHPNDREKASFLKDNILPIQESGQLKFIEGESFTDNFSVRLVNGHTNSMMLPQLNYKGRTIVYMADLLPSAAHLPIPYVMAYDMFPLTTLQEKKSFLTEAVENRYLLYFEHDPQIELAELVQTEKGVRAGATLQLKEL
jgi:glyoxylase-like metal-dependent hydrolase (beta-lactamase superfamily II)